ncbi:hypothetical protein [Actinacidiphila bryophytorum]|uniref:hypothetical protein n=1 Tax=Actinacidiphila bryophytorum TaxID=1436133 RepID=UPI002176AAA6|nr:hypothetical protein [Actinacidiphila bryophytorum]UWE07947.1 hypothetical protein NYE86_03825 [Actinacidiphila bryophytorum]
MAAVLVALLEAVEAVGLLDRGLETLVEVVTDQRRDDVVLGGHPALGGMLADPVPQVCVYAQAEHSRCHEPTVAGGSGDVRRFRLRSHPFG